MARKIEINADGGGFTALTVDSSCTGVTTGSIEKYTSITTGNDWDTIVTGTSADADAARLTAATNSSTSPREGYGYISYTVNGNACTNIIHLVQGGKAYTCSDLKIVGKTIQAEGYIDTSISECNYNLGFYHNVNVYVDEAECNWLHELHVDTCGDGYYDIVADRFDSNNTGAERTATVYIKSDECSLTSFTVTQKACDVEDILISTTTINSDGTVNLNAMPYSSAPKVRVKYKNGTSATTNCNGNGILTYGDITGTTAIRGNIREIEVGPCVDSISTFAFSNCSGATKVTLPDSLTTLDSHCMEYLDSLTSITIPGGVSEIPYECFYGLDALTSATLSEGVTSINTRAFADCKLVEISLPNTLRTIGGGAFIYCDSLTSVTIPNSVTSIDASAFYRCNQLRNVTIGNSVTSIGKDAFYNCWSMTACTIGNSVRTISEGAFGSCQALKSINIPNSVRTIAKEAFDFCSDATILTIGNSVTSIGESAFYNCWDIANAITIPSTITSIGKQAFYGCRSLASITIEKTTPPTLGDNAFDGTGNCPIYVPASAVNAYKTATKWSTWADRIQAIP